MSKRILTPEREEKEKALAKARLIAEVCKHLDITPPQILVAAAWTMALADVGGTLKALRGLHEAIETICAVAPDDPSKAN